MKVLFIGNKSKNYEDIELIIETLFHLDFYWVESLAELKKELSLTHSIISIITLTDTSELISILNYFKNITSIPTPILLSSHPLKDKIQYYNEYRFIELLIGASYQTIENAIKKSANISQLKAYDRFSKINITHFLNFNYFNSDIYLKLTDTKYIKVVNKDEMYDTLLIDKYINRGVQYLYIESNNLSFFINYFQSTLRSNLLNEPSKQKDIFEVQTSSIELLQELINSINIPKHTVSMVNELATLNITLLKKLDFNLFNLIQDLIKKKSYIYEHSLMVSYISISIAHYMNWTSEYTLKKLSMASLLHDLLLKPEISEYHDGPQNSIDQLDWKLIKEIKEHPLVVAQKIRLIDGLSPDIDKILLNHHEEPDATGYPRGLSSHQLSPISCIFILAERATVNIYKNGVNPYVKSKMLKDLHKYNCGNFKKAFQGLSLMVNF